MLEVQEQVLHDKFSNILHIFVGKGLDVLQSKIKPFEEYLAGLLKKPFLKESDILFTFLTSNDEFTMASSTLGVGKIINKVNPMKLTTKERGQSLQPFIDNFVSSTLSSPSKPRLLEFFQVITCSWHQKTNSPIHEFKLLHKSQRAF